MQCNFLALFFLELMAAQPGGNTVKLRLSAQLLPETSKHRENSHHNLKMLKSRPHVFIFGTRIVRSRWQWQQKRKAQMRKRLLRVKMLGVQRECVAGQIMINHTMQFKSGDSLPFDWIGRNFELQQSAFSCTGVRFPSGESPPNTLDLQVIWAPEQTKLSRLTGCVKLNGKVSSNANAKT